MNPVCSIRALRAEVKVTYSAVWVALMPGPGAGTHRVRELTTPDPPGPDWEPIVACHRESQQYSSWR